MNDLQGSSVLKYLQSSSALTETRRALFPKALTEIFGANNTLANLSVATPNRMFDLIRGMETDLNNVWHRMMPTLDSIGRHWSGMLEALPRIDWEAVERAARIREARRPRTRIGFAALNAYDELYMGHPWVADEFLLDYLGIEPSADRREALWIVLRQAFERTVPYPARWIVLDDKRAAAYLRTSVYRQARRVERNRERPDRVWWTERDPKTKKKIELPRPVQPEHDIEVMAEGSGNPADIVANYMDDRAKVILLLYEKGSNEDKEFIRLFLTGHSQADIARDYGWAKVLRFTRKAERWRIKHNPPIDG